MLQDDTTMWKEANYTQLHIYDDGTQNPLI